MALFKVINNEDTDIPAYQTKRINLLKHQQKPCIKINHIFNKNELWFSYKGQHQHIHLFQNHHGFSCVFNDNTKILLLMKGNANDYLGSFFDFSRITGEFKLDHIDDHRFIFHGLVNEKGLYSRSGSHKNVIDAGAKEIILTGKALFDFFVSPEQEQTLNN